MKFLQRISLTLLLILFLLGAVGHALLPAGDLYHVQAETNCAFHHGINLPVVLQASINTVDMTLASIPDTTCAFALAFRIPRPPTF